MCAMGAKPRGLIGLQEISDRTGLSLSALNYYTNIGLLPVAERRGNRRLFVEEEVLRRIEEIRRLRREGYPLRIIRRQWTEESSP